MGMNAKLVLRPVVAILLAASLSAACASRTTTPPKGGSPSGLVLRVDTRGGLLAPAVALTRIPQFSLYADGLIIMEGAQIEIYPGPATPPVFSTRVDAEGLKKIIDTARRAGLDGPDRSYNHPTVMDAGTTTFTFVENGRRHVISLAGLGIAGPGQAMSGAERKARAALLQLETKLQTLRSWLPAGSLSADRPFDYKKVAVIVSTQPFGEKLKEPELTWPLDRSIADLAKPAPGGPTLSCLTVQGQDLTKVRPLVERANELTPWKSDGRTYWLRFRPLLPDESGCPQA